MAKLKTTSSIRCPKCQAKGCEKTFEDEDVLVGKHIARSTTFCFACGYHRGSIVIEGAEILVIEKTNSSADVTISALGVVFDA